MRAVRNKYLPVLLFDLQNAIPTPHANISSLFHLRKLNIYNSAAYCTPTKQVYCALWSENLSGCAGPSLRRSYLHCIWKAKAVDYVDDDLTEEQLLLGRSYHIGKLGIWQLRAEEDRKVGVFQCFQDGDEEEWLQRQEWFLQ
ncbi:hypothetical protein AVEN_216546-1 [Araneus ventricosus]|uniref:Uncharacterized protein n=1 Tax=Araneus ventricosus TaxID=182803 RepID=A0A4Y2EY82_ARAVE|nr:hypothetical protein AVEN_216546-1 [Araneus ventricosus]